jgi:hypothetical protein
MRLQGLDAFSALHFSPKGLGEGVDGVARENGLSIFCFLDFFLGGERLCEILLMWAVELLLAIYIHSLREAVCGFGTMFLLLKRR